MEERIDASTAATKAREAVSAMSVEEKARLTAGASFWTTADVEGVDDASSVPSITVTDGPNGMRKQVVSFDHMGIAESLPATCFPCACLSGCTFDEYLLELMGRAIGEECRAEDVSVLLGPGVNIKRHPLGGRNFEYFSEDPLLTGKLGAAFVRGVQSSGTGACVKHLAANSQEIRRMTSDSVIDETTLIDIYLKPFETIVREANPAAIMPAYNRLNGHICAENPKLLARLRDKWGFNGTVISDWGGMDQSVASVEAGLDLCMPGPREDHVRAVVGAAHAGTLSADALDRAAEAVAKLAFAHKPGEGPEAQNLSPEARDEMFAEHLAIAQLVAEEGCVLLKNEGVLPFDGAESLAVIGAFAKEPRYQGSGSSKVNPVALDNMWDALAEAGVEARYAAGYDPVSGKTTEELLDEAARVAAACDNAVVLVGLPDFFESEGFDRADMNLPEGMNALVSRVAAANPNTAVVVSGGGCVTMPWKDEVSAILAGYLAGCRGGHALTNLLTGVVSPSGRLAESWPESVADTALGEAFPVHESEILYTEGPFVGYRYYTSAAVPVAYPFGYGLTYTCFEYANLAVKPSRDGYTVSFDLSNVGDRDGVEVVQVYVIPPCDAAPVPRLALAAFKRVSVAAGQTVRVTLPLGIGAFTRWDASRHEPRVDAGEYEVAVGASCTDVRLRAVVTLDADAPFEVSEPHAYSEAERLALAPYFQPVAHGFTRDSFAALYGAPYPKPLPLRPFTPNTRLGDLRETTVGRILFWVIENRGRSVTADDQDSHRMLEQTFADLPLRSLVLGKVPYEVVCAFAGMLNGHPTEAVKAVIGILTYRP